jgi:hypothetical protein
MNILLGKLIFLEYKYMRKKKLVILLLIFIAVLILGYLLIKPSFNYLSGYLSKSEQVKANILIVEGWLPDHALKMAFQEFQENGYELIVTTGLKSPISYFKVFSNGYLIFYSKNRFSGLNEYGPHSIEIDAFSELGWDNRAHFNLFINDSIVADFYAEKKEKKYRISWNGYLNKIDSIMVHFDNDNWGEFGDRNLFVKEINIDNKITIPYQNNSVYEVSNIDGKERYINNFNSNAEQARNRLLLMGIDSSLIIAVPGERVIINRTLTSALAFRNWLTTTDLNIKGINIISMGAHARRTWMTYNKVLDEKYEIGVISIPDSNNSFLGKRKVLKTLRETLGIIYYWLILIPY